MTRRLSGPIVAFVLLAALAPSVMAAPSASPTYVGDPPLVPLYAGDALGTSFIPSPFADSSGQGDYAVVKSDIQVTYIGFGAVPQAQAAFEHAVDIWERLITSPRVIHISATWADLGNPALLGSAGSDGDFICLGGTAACPDALAEALCNCNQTDNSGPEPSDPEINANFNSAFPNWYFGTDGAVAPGDFDFVTVVLHELGHGLGMNRSFNYNSGTGAGSWGLTDGVNTYGYGTDLRYYDASTGGNLLTNTSVYANPSVALGTALKSNSVYYEGTNVSAVLGGRAKIYAPTTYASGSSMSHLDETTYPQGTPNSLMTPFLNYGEAIHNPGPVILAIFRDIGWDADGCSAAPFPDVAIGHAFCLEIKWMKDNGIATGFGDGNYHPGDVVNRQGMSAFMARLALGAAGSAALPACSTQPFTDVPTSNTFCPQIKWLSDQGVVGGFPDGSFKPGSAVTRQAMAAFLARLALGAAGAAALPACTSQPFTDVATTHPFCEEIKWMKDTEISTGLGDGSYGPSQSVKRQSMSAFMFRANSQL
jgi:hypothetical protein